MSAPEVSTLNSHFAFLDLGHQEHVFSEASAEQTSFFMSDENPSIVFVPAAWHSAEHFDEIRANLANRGFPSVAVSNPSNGCEPPDKTMHDDAAVIRAAVEDLVNEGRNVIVVAHSYGGIPAGSAVDGLAYSIRAKEGKKGGVIMFVYMMSIPAAKGKSMADIMAESNYEMSYAATEGKYVKMLPDAFKETLYHDLSTQQRDAELLKCTPHISIGAITESATYEPWKHMPCMYIFGVNDPTIPLYLQENLASTLGDYISFHTESAHAPWVSVPDTIVEAIELASEMGLERSKKF